MTRQEYKDIYDVVGAAQEVHYKRYVDDGC
jgi:hypothetical protein